VVRQRILIARAESCAAAYTKWNLPFLFGWFGNHRYAVSLVKTTSLFTDKKKNRSFGRLLREEL